MMGNESQKKKAAAAAGTPLILLLFVFVPVSTLILYISIFSNPRQIVSNSNTSVATSKYQHHHHHRRPNNRFLAAALTEPFQQQQEQQLRLAQFHCEDTLYPELCITTLSSFPDLHKKPMKDIISATLDVTVDEVKSSASNCSGVLGNMTSGSSLPAIQQKRAVQDCVELLDETLDELQSACSDLNGGVRSKKKMQSHVQTLLSGAMTNQFTCLNGLQGCANTTLLSEIEKIVQPRLTQISQHVSNALAMLKKTRRRAPSSSSSSSSRRRRLYDDDLSRCDGFPKWMSRKDRRLLQTPTDEIKYDLVVAKDGSGNFTTVGEAVAAAPTKSMTRFVIYIKAGAYLENVEVKKKVTMIMFLGDGIEKTVIKANRNVVDGWTTFRSATLAVVGAGFIARGISVENSSGPEKHQAVALRSGSDLSAFYRCSFVGYQDTLYVHSLRQFYRECDVYGTVDFIFGNAAVVLQKCNLYARKPNANQKNIVTAQGRDDPNENTGISIIDCKIAAAADLLPNKSAFPTYLGRPWRNYSRTVVMESYIDDVVVPAGWLEWAGDFALDTLFYGEYRNTGPGANTSARVTWLGYHPVLNSSEATHFSVAKFIQGTEWLPAYQIPAS